MSRSHCFVAQNGAVWTPSSFLQAYQLFSLSCTLPASKAEALMLTLPP